MSLTLPEPHGLISLDLTIVFTMGWRGISAPVLTASPPPPSSVPWCLKSSCSHIFSLLSSLVAVARLMLFPLIYVIIPEVLLLPLMGSALEPAGIASIIRASGSFSQK